MSAEGTCPNCGSEATLQYLSENTEEYAFSVCDDCDEEFDESEDEDE